jgi:mono/diheme cytochrome c family protein
MPAAEFPEGLQGDVQRGTYLARAGGCIACHTDTEAGGAPLAGGAALQTPFGSFVPSNLTTDPDHGIGAWTVADFARAVRHGVSPEGQPYYPAFPSAFYSRLTDQDIADLWAAFQTVPPVAQPAADSRAPFPFSFRAGLKLWRAVYRDHPPAGPVAGQDEVWNRGLALAEGIAHCGACHTPRNVLGGLKTAARLSGAEGLPGGGKAPAITAEALRNSDWSEEDLAYALEDGQMPDGDVFGGSMAKVVRHGTAYLTFTDRAAIAHYLLNPASGG